MRAARVSGKLAHWTFSRKTMNWLGSQLVPMPKSLQTVATIDEPSEVNPAEAGLSDEAIRTIWRSVKDLYRAGAYPALTFCLRRRDRIVMNRALGHASGNGPQDPRNARKRHALPGTPVCAFSASKAITAILVHKLAEEGGVDLDRKVIDYIPEFGQNGKSRTTIAEVLSHRGGFPMFELKKEDMQPEYLLDWDRCVRMICEAPPTHRGAPRLAYHAITGGFILGEIIHRVTGVTISQYLDERIRKPLGMKHFTFGLPPEERKNAALNYVAGLPVRWPISKLLEKVLMVPLDRVVEVSNSQIFMEAVIPAGNLYCTAEELSRFYQMLLDHGVYKGQQVMRRETVERAVRPACRLQLDRTLMIPMRYSEGLMLGQNPFGLYGPMSGKAFGHLGLMNILGWADPTRDIAVGIMTTGKAVLGGHVIALGELLTTIAWQCRE
jgi:CubicO group peptidase (beta-lactamase class C family)